MRGPSRGASRRGGGSSGLIRLGCTSVIRQGVGRSGEGAMSRVMSALMTLVSTPACQATLRRCRHRLIHSAARRRGATTSTLPAMSASPWSRSIITPGSRHIAGARLAPRADSNTLGNRIIRRRLHSLIRLCRHLPRHCQHDPRHRPVIHAASPHRHQPHPPRRTRAATGIEGHHGCLLVGRCSPWSPLAE